MEDREVGLGLGLPGGEGRHKCFGAEKRHRRLFSSLSVNRTLKVAFSRFSLNLFSYFCQLWPLPFYPNPFHFLVSSI